MAHTYRVVELDNDYRIVDDCGHKHRTIHSAETCHERLTASRCGGCGRSNAGAYRCRECSNTGNRYFSSKFYRSTIERSDGARQGQSEEF